MAQTTPATIAGPKQVVSRAITHSDANTTVGVNIPANVFIPPWGVRLYVVEAFAGGSPSLDVGDTTTTNGWIATADVDETTPNWYCGTAANGATYAPTGRVYTSADTIDVTVATGATNGTAYVSIEYWDISNRDVAASS